MLLPEVREVKVDQEYLRNYTAAHHFATDQRDADLPTAEAYAYWYATTVDPGALDTAFWAWPDRAKYRP